jgi:hypothetical protein
MKGDEAPMENESIVETSSFGAGPGLRALNLGLFPVPSR